MERYSQFRLTKSYKEKVLFLLKHSNHKRTQYKERWTATETASTKQGESSVRGMLNQLNLRLFLNCNVIVNVHVNKMITVSFCKLISKHTYLDILGHVFGI